MESQNITLLEPTLYPDALTNSLLSQLSTFAEALQAARREALTPYIPPSWTGVPGMADNALSWPTDSTGEPLYKHELTPQEHTVIDTFTDELDATLLGHGVARAVIEVAAVDGYVFKLGRWGPDIMQMSGCQQNLFEARAYERYQYTHSPPILPTIAIANNGDWSLQPKVALLKDEPPREAKNVHKPSHPVRRQMHWRTKSLSHVIFFEGFLPHNVGRWQGEWYVIDYGRPRHGGESYRYLGTFCS